MESLEQGDQTGTYFIPSTHIYLDQVTLAETNDFIIM